MKPLRPSRQGYSYRALAIYIYILTLCIASSVLADTEIRNFKIPLPPSTRSIHPSTEILRVSDLNPDYQRVTTTINVSDECPERWLQFTPESGHSSWTVRLSWPGSSPTKFDLEVLASPEDNDDDMIVHITAAQLSPRFPRHPYFGTHSQIPHVPAGSSATFFTPVAVTIEPLLMGVLPRTSLPAVAWIIIFAVGASTTVPHILRYLDRMSAVGDIDLKEKRA